MIACEKKSCYDCCEPYVCHCLQVTEAQVVDAIVSLEIRSVKDIQQHTSAGSGCTACHARISLLIQAFSSEPICSVK